MRKLRYGHLVPSRCAILAMLLLVMQPLALAQSLVMGILPLRYRTADQMVPLIRPLVPPPGTVSGIQNQLIVHTTPQNLAEIRAVLERIDTMPRRLLISVRQDVDQASGADGVVAGVRAGVGQTDIAVGSLPPGAAAGVRAYSTARSGSDRAIQQVQALEGQPAMIQAGRSIPVPVRQIVRGPSGLQAIDTIEYREASTGFQVVVRLSGDEVMLDILPQRQSIAQGAGHGTVDTQQLSTTARGRLGEWIDLGGTVRTSGDRQSVLLGRTTSSSAEERRVQVRVEELR